MPRAQRLGGSARSGKDLEEPRGGRRVLDPVEDRLDLEPEAPRLQVAEDVRRGAFGPALRVEALEGRASDVRFEGEGELALVGAVRRVGGDVRVGRRGRGWTRREP